MKGVGPDTLSDIISSFFEDRRKKPGRGSDAKWQPDPKVLALLMPKKPRAKPTKKVTRKRATRKKAKKK